VAAAYVLVTPVVFPAYTPDFDQLWIAARLWREGQNPYPAILALHQQRGLYFGLVYPFTAIVAVLPLSFLPLEAARAVVVAAAAGSLAFLVLGRAWWLFPVLLSGAFRAAISQIQVSPFAACALIVPWFGWVAAFKPNIGAAIFATYEKRAQMVKFLVPAAALTVVSLVLWPGWLPDWRRGFETLRFNRPIVLHPFGWLLPLALLRWRLPEARWLAATALLPGTPSMYDAVPLLVLLPRSLRQALVFAILTHLADIGGYWLAGRAIGLADQAGAHATASLWFVYLPALATILLRKSSANTVSPPPEH